MSAYVFVGELMEFELQKSNIEAVFFLELLNPHLWSVRPLTQTHHWFLLVKQLWDL